MTSIIVCHLGEYINKYFKPDLPVTQSGHQLFPLASVEPENKANIVFPLFSSTAFL